MAPRGLVVLAFVGAASLGLPDALLGVAWPSIRDAFGRAQGNLGLFVMASGAGYFVSSFFGGRLTARLGIGLLLGVSGAAVAAGCLGTALSPAWIAALAAAALAGLGSGAIDAGLNTFAAARFSARSMNWMHACYSAGAMAGPLIMTSVLAGGRSWRLGYGLIAGLMALLAALFWTSRSRWGAPSTAPAPPRSSRLGSLAWLNVAVFFAYTGLEVAVGQWAFTWLTESRGVDRVRAGTAVAGYWGSFALGRVLFGMVAERVGLDRLLRGCLAAALAGTGLLAARTSDAATIAGLLLIGLALSPVYPCLMTRTPARLGPELAARAIGWQVSAAMLGAAAVPALFGLAVSRSTLEAVPATAVVAALLLVALHETLVRASPSRA